MLTRIKNKFKNKQKIKNSGSKLKGGKIPFKKAPKI